MNKYFDEIPNCKVQQRQFAISPESAVDVKLDAVLVSGENEVERVVIALNGKIIDIDLASNSAEVIKALGHTYHFKHIKSAKAVRNA